MSVSLPPALEAAAAALLEGVSRNRLAVRFGRIAEQYAQGGGSAAVVQDETDATAYVFSRLPGTFAAISSVFGQITDLAPDFRPSSVVDVGAGPAGASWAAVQAWPNIAHLTLVDSNRSFLAIAGKLAAAADHPALTAASQLVADFTHADIPSADLVVAGYALAEVAPPKVAAVVARLWAACRGALVLVEPGTPAGFARIHEARAALIGQGASILAPCTHVQACPMRAPNWCHFSERLPRSRDHMRVKAASAPYEDEVFSYLVATRFPPAASAPARVLTPPRQSKIEVAYTVCAVEGLIDRRIPRRNRDAYSRARKLNWGDLEPADIPSI